MCKGESHRLQLSTTFVNLHIHYNRRDNDPLYVSQEDLYYPHPMIQDLIWDSLYIFTEPILNRWPFNKLVRKKALEVTMNHIHYEDENSRYITIASVEKVSIITIKHIELLII